MPIMSSTIVPNSPTIVARLFQTRPANYASLAHEQDKVRQIHPRQKFSDEEADAVSHQTPDERVHGVEPN